MKRETHPAYRPSIDGLRAVAILSVLGFHAFPAWVPGGFVGVDVFFVISGFLISGILLSHLQAGSFSLVDFYARRVRRIFPALLVVLIAVAAFGFFVLWPDEYRALGAHIAGGAGFIANIQSWNESGYFDAAAATKPLLHLWSLGVEEQFYIFWPLMLAAAWRWKHRAGAMIGFVIAASFIANIWFMTHDRVWDFYSPFTRFWELLAGGALAWLAQHQMRVRSSALREVFAGAGLVMILIADFIVHKAAHFPGCWALLPAGGACLMIAAEETALANRKILASSFMVGIGLISYPLYLWHWPLLSYAQILSGEEPERVWRLAMVVLAFALAAATYRFVEQPLRAGRLDKKPVLLLLALMVAVGGAGAGIYAADGLPARMKDRRAGLSLDSDALVAGWRKDIRFGLCHLDDADMRAQPAACIEAKHPLLLLWGDSHAAAFYPGLKDLQSAYGFGIAQLTQAACPPLFDLPELGKNCKISNQRTLAQLAAIKPDVILLSSAWLHNDYPDSAIVVAHLIDAVSRIKQAAPQARVIVIGPMPRWLSPLPSIYRRSLSFDGHMPPVSMFKHSDMRIMPLDILMQGRLAAAGIAYLSPVPVLCDAAGCLTRLGDGVDSIAYVDEEHVSAAVSGVIIDRFAPQILSALGIAKK